MSFGEKRIVLTELGKRELSKTFARSSMNQSNLARRIPSTFSSNVEAKVTESFTKVGYIPGIGQSEEFAGAAFDLEIGALSSPVEGDQGIYILSPSEKEPIDEETFKSEKEDFKQNQLEKKRTDYFVEWFEGLREEANIEVFEN